MQRPSYNPSNYYLTQDGVISKIDSYWDKLREHIEEMEQMTCHTFRRLANVFGGSVLGIVPILWLSPSKSLGMLVLVGVLLISLLLVGLQIVIWWEFQSVKKRATLLYESLKVEVRCEYFEEEDIPLDERVILKHFELASRFPVHPALYIALLVSVVTINTLFLWAYYFYW